MSYYSRLVIDILFLFLRITVTVRRTPDGSPKRVRRISSSSEEGIIH